MKGYLQAMTPTCQFRKEGRDMGVASYTSSSGQKLWTADFRVKSENGRTKRIIRRDIPTKELALAFEKKLKVESFEGRYFDKLRSHLMTVASAWKAYKPKGERDNRSWQTDMGRATHLLHHLGDRRADLLTEKDVEEYRKCRMAETTKRGGPPTPATLDREVELLKRVLNYNARCGSLRSNPVARVPLLCVPNTRDVTISEVDFKRLLTAAEPALKPILFVAYDGGLRVNEVLGLKWSQVDLQAGMLRLPPQDLKAEKNPRNVVLTARTLGQIRALDKSRKSSAARDAFVFVNPETETRWKDIRKMWKRALLESGLDAGVWFHDQRRSFVTNARRRGVDESTVMRMSGHRTRAVFERYSIVDDHDLREAVRRIEAGSKAELAKDRSRKPRPGKARAGKPRVGKARAGKARPGKTNPARARAT
jgi:integrase